MADIRLDLSNLHELFPDDFDEDQVARARTVFLKELALEAHRFYGGKMTTVPKAGLYGFNWFNVYYTPGVSAVSTTIRDDYDTSYDLSNRGNLVAVVSDSTRVLGDGDVGPPGGLGVMEGKAFLMKYLGGVDATALCINSYNDKCEHDPDLIIDFVKMVEPTFGAVNLEDISQPNCYRVLDTLREACNIPVWHDDAQGTGCVTLAGLINALKVVEKPISEVKIFMLGAGASNTTIARLIVKAGGDPKKMIIFDSKGSLHADRKDIHDDKRYYRKWELCERTNPGMVTDVKEAVRGADVLISLSKPDPTTVKPEWIRSMASKPIVFACANPVPEIYPHAAREVGAYIVATGRGDFLNQVNNSLGFPGILKGCLIIRAKEITDRMALPAARSLARSAEKKGLSPEHIIPAMDEEAVFAEEAAAVAAEAVENGVARVEHTEDEVIEIASRDIEHSRKLIHHLMGEQLISEFPVERIQDALDKACAAVRGGK